MQNPVTTNPFWLVEQYRATTTANNKTAKDSVKVVNAIVSFVNEWDFNRKVEAALDKIQAEVKSYLRTSPGVLIRIWADVITGANGEKTKIFQGLEIIGHGESPRNVTYLRRDSMFGTFCDPDSIRRRNCAQIAEFKWITMFGMQNILTSL